MSRHSARYDEYVEAVGRVVRLPQLSAEVRRVAEQEARKAQETRESRVSKVTNSARSREHRLQELTGRGHAAVSAAGHADLIPAELPRATNSVTTRPAEQVLGELEEALTALRARRSEIAEQTARDEEQRRKIEEDARRRAESSSRKQGLIGLIVAVGLPGAMGAILNSRLGGSYFLIGCAAAVLLSLILGRPVGAYIVSSMSSAGQVRERPQGFTGIVITAGLGGLAASVGGLLTATYSAEAANYAVPIFLGAVLLRAGCEATPIVRMTATARRVQTPVLWDGVSGLAAFVLVIVPVMLMSKTSSATNANGLGLLLIMLAAAIPTVGRAARNAVLGLVRAASKSSQHIVPGSVVWTWIRFSDDITQGKDRPVVVMTVNGSKLQVLPMTSKEHANRSDEMTVGSGPWDPRGRTSYLKLATLIQVDRQQVRRVAGRLDDRRFAMVMREVARHHPSIGSTTQKGADGRGAAVDVLAYGAWWAAVGVLLFKLVTQIG